MPSTSSIACRTLRCPGGTTPACAARYLPANRQYSCIVRRHFGRRSCLRGHGDWSNGRSACTKKSILKPIVVFEDVERGGVAWRRRSRQAHVITRLQTLQQFRLASGKGRDHDIRIMRRPRSGLHRAGQRSAQHVGHLHRAPAAAPFANLVPGVVAGIHRDTPRISYQSGRSVCRIQA